MNRRRSLVAVAAGCLAALATVPLVLPDDVLPAAAAAEPLQVLGFLGEQRIAPGTRFAETTVGGISGIDHDPATGTWYLISDDRSVLQPARFYSAALAFDGATADGTGGALSGVELTGTAPLRRAGGAPYAGFNPGPPLLPGPAHVPPDPEDIRFDPLAGRLLWTQEGDRHQFYQDVVTLLDPGVRAVGTDGSFHEDLPTPVEQQTSAPDSGVRPNLGPEALTLAAGGNLIVTAVEGPLLQDGPLPTRTTGARTRIVATDRAGAVVGQFGYDLEPLFADPVPADGFSVTGVTGILAIDDQDPNRYLVLERSFVTGVGNRAVLYEVDLAGATDLADGTPIAAAVPATKRALLDVSTLPVGSVDNIEGLAWGPDRADGSRTLVLVSDDNFAAEQVTQFIAVAVG